MRKLLHFIHRLLMSRSEAKYLELLESREELDDAQFHARFYADTEVPPDVAARARATLEDATGFDLDALHPGDNIAITFDDLDFADVLYRMSRVFPVSFPPGLCWEVLDGTFDTLVRYIARNLNEG